MMNQTKLSMVTEAFEQTDSNSPLILFTSLLGKLFTVNIFVCPCLEGVASTWALIIMLSNQQLSPIMELTSYVICQWGGQDKANMLEMFEPVTEILTIIRK